MEIEEIIQFLSDELAVNKSKIEADIDLYSQSGVEGDDCFDFEEATLNLGSLFFKPPYERVQRIPITLKILAQSAVGDALSVIYPEHKLPKRRYNIYINYFVISTLALGTFIVGLKNV
ncbi:MAG TPA: hypothetical protein ENI26_10760 [Methylophaga aminisulfidivorans]|nr:hypothetical protein [Methylophaga sp.]HEC74833.1 hypothetical protein [Methylophaga aminisulfidivorans]